MADTDETNASPASAQVDPLKASPVPVSGKSAMRRKMVGRGQTSLSSRSPMVLPSEGQALLNTPKPDALKSSALGAVEPLAVDASTIESVLPVPAVEAAIAKRSVGRPRKVPVAASSFAEAVTAVEPAPIMPAKVKPAKVKMAKIKAAPADLTRTEMRGLQPTTSSNVSPNEVVAAPVAQTPDPEITKPSATPNPTHSPVSSIKDITMDMSANFNGFQGAMSEAQAKAQAAFEKSSSMLSEAGDFAKGNVEAVIESSKIFAEGVQSMGSSMVAEGRTTFEAMTGDIKELAAVKSPTDFFKLQGDLVRKNFDNAVAQSSKNTETLLKLMSDAFAPVSGRVSLAVEKVRQVAPMSATAAPMTVDA